MYVKARTTRRWAVILENAVVTLPILLSLSADPGCLLTPACLAAYPYPVHEANLQYIGFSSIIFGG